MSININSIKSFIWRAFPHIFEECLKARHPFLAHSYSSSAIIRIFMVIGIIAARFCVLVRFARSCCFSINSMPMSQRAFPRRFNAQATAAFCAARAQAVQCNNNRLSTIAFKKPRSPFAWVVDALDCHQFPKSVARNIKGRSQNKSPLIVAT